jgi:hypothetical protein
MSPAAYSGQNESRRGPQSRPALRRYYAARTSQRDVPITLTVRTTEKMDK